MTENSTLENNHHKLRGRNYSLKSFACCLFSIVPFMMQIIGVSGEAQGTCSPQIFSISSHFVLLEALSETKYRCSHKIQNFVPPQLFLPPSNFELATPLMQILTTAICGQKEKMGAAITRDNNRCKASTSFPLLQLASKFLSFTKEWFTT